MIHRNPFELVMTWTRDQGVSLTEKQRLSLQQEVLEYGGHCIDLYKRGLIQKLGEWFSLVMGN